MSIRIIVAWQRFFRLERHAVRSEGRTPRSPVLQALIAYFTFSVPEAVLAFGTFFQLVSSPRGFAAAVAANSLPFFNLLNTKHRKSEDFRCFCIYHVSTLRTNPTQYIFENSFIFPIQGSISASVRCATGRTSAQPEHIRPAPCPHKRLLPASPASRQRARFHQRHKGT